MALTPLKFSALTAAAALGGTEIVPIVQGGANVRTTPNAIKTFVLSGLAGTSVGYTPAGNIAASNVSGAIDELDTEKVAKVGDTMTGALTVEGIFTPKVNSGITVSIERYQDNGNGAQAIYRKYRGTMTSPTAVLDSDGAARYTGAVWDGAISRIVGFLDFTLTGAAGGVTVGTAHPSMLRLYLCKPGASATGGAGTDEVFRFSHANGLQLFGANTVIDANRHIQLRSYTIGTLPSAATAGQIVYCSDLGGGAGQLNSDGTNWRRVSRGGTQAIATDAAATLTPLTSAENIRHTGTLTANRVITLSTTNAYSGARFRVTRTGAGAFNLDIGGLKNLATNTWCEVEYNGSAWFLAAYGAL